MERIVNCEEIIKTSVNLEETSNRIVGLLGKIQEKIDIMVEESLQ